MAFIGNFAAAQSATAIGKYNEGVYKQRADLQRARTAQNKAIIPQITTNNSRGPRERSPQKCAKPYSFKTYHLLL